ncbi:lipid IV(A) 3-deoxy-D-manno-octulosonic acid transferase [Hydrogenimonas cancrithermarum]|uniref:lipid IV(A) 3-deoxy-D-manno-octulosonic acid transferase n=1 Tax=Hydrogenimonas cancrithermarum TaxID=2993563 RepID=UPI002574877B|nr:lipid IV(A) 3-deoxy-D-manno-octulosonic acid transferase [Hydrogenimonas cancrithermarum]
MWGLYLLFLPIILLFSFKKKYRRSIPARFFLWHNPPLPEGRIWFHACSFGETRALKPLIEALDADEVALTTTTQTGFEEAKKVAETVRYLPFEPLLWLWVRPQKVLVVMEAELWYLLFYLAKRSGAKTMLINARISDRSYRSYLRFAWFYRKIFANIDEVYAQSETDKRRLLELGAKDVKVTGNIKLAQPAKATRRYAKPEGIVVTAASTHEGEEEGILDAFVAWKKRHPDAKLLLVPRHPERFGKVAAVAESAAREAGLSFSRWSEEAALDADIVLIDAMGELVNFYAISDIVVLGGAFVPVGGHNPAEVIPFGCRLVSGREIFNQKAMFSAVEGAIFCDLETLETALDRALEGEPLRLETAVSLEPLFEGMANVV